MDHGTLPLKRLVSALYGTNLGKPCIVIGGGPSALDDLAKIPGWQDMLQISANGHGFKVPGASPSYIFTKDDAECPPRPRKPGAGPFPPMEPQMRVHGVPIISIQYWADYRCAAWPFQGNSGQHALAVGALMGSAPTIGVGFDCFQGRTYFHSDGPNVSGGKKPGYWQYRYSRFRDRFRGGVSIRGVSGQLVDTFGRYDPAERIVGAVPPVLKLYADLPTVHVRARKEYRDPGKTTAIPKGYVYPVSAAEAQVLCGRGFAERA